MSFIGRNRRWRLFDETGRIADGANPSGPVILKISMSERPPAPGR